MLGEPGAGWRTRRRQQREYHDALDAQVQEARQRKQESRDARRGADAGQAMFPALAPNNPAQAEPADDRMEMYRTAPICRYLSVFTSHMDFHTLEDES